MLGVDLLEVVDVDQDERERSLVALGASRLGPQLLVEGAVVGQVRQLVAGGKRAELGAGVGEADGRLSGEGESRERSLSRAHRDECAPEPSADADRRRTWRRPARSERPSRPARPARATRSCRG